MSPASKRSALQSTATTDGCTSPVGLCTAGTFRGDHLLRGTTSFVADGLAPAAGMPAVEAGTTLSYSGLLTITTRRGTLTTRDTGIFDTAGTGLFASRDVVDGLGLNGFADGKNPIALALEWGVRRLGETLVLRTRAGIQKPVTVDFAE